MKKIFSVYLFSMVSLYAFAQEQGFENWPDEHEYLKSSWETDGFVPR